MELSWSSSIPPALVCGLFANIGHVLFYLATKVFVKLLGVRKCCCYIEDVEVGKTPRSVVVHMKADWMVENSFNQVSFQKWMHAQMKMKSAIN